ncbi:ankyrin repeat domain-containing protein [Ottowia thiooxydans]
MDAIRNGDVENAKVAAGKLAPSEINHLDHSPDTALTLAVQLKRTEIVKLLINRLGTPEAINLPRPDGNTALTLAVRLESTEMVKLLVGSLTPAELNAPGAQGTALMLAVRDRSFACGKVLAKRLTPYQINYVDHGMTALMHAVSWGNAYPVLMLMKSLKTPDAINQPMADGRTALMLAAAIPHGRYSWEVMQAMVSELRPHQGAINACTPDGHTALSIAYDHQNHEAVNLLLNALTFNGRTAGSSPVVDEVTLRIAGESGHFGLLIKWLSSGAHEALAETFFKAFDEAHNVRQIDQEVLLHAAEAGCSRVVSILLRRGANTAVVTEDFLGPLDLAARGGHFSVLEAWMAAGHTVPSEIIVKCLGHESAEMLVASLRPSLPHLAGHPNAQDRQPGQALDRLEKARSALLMLATQNGWVHLAKALMYEREKTLDGVIDVPRVSDEDLRTAGRQGNFELLFTEIGLWGESEEIVKAFFDGFSAAKLPPRIHDYALHEAANCGYARIALELLKREADTLRTDGRARTALDLAVENGHLSVLNAWLACGHRVTPERIFAAMQASGRYGAKALGIHRVLAVDASGLNLLALAQSNGWAHLAQTLSDIHLQINHAVAPLSLLNDRLAKGHGVHVPDIVEAMQATGLYAVGPNEEPLSPFNFLSAVDFSESTVQMLAISCGMTQLAHWLNQVH